MKSILITGGAGFIGSHTCLQLLEKGYFLIVIDSFINSSPKVVKRLEKLYSNGVDAFKQRFRLIKGDIRDKSLIKNIFDDAEKSNSSIEAVIHFAGLKAVSESVLFPTLYWDVNVGGSINLMQIMEQYKCWKIVFSSSATIYSPQGISPLSEDAEIKPTNPYGQTKATVENLLKNVYESNESNWKIINLRYFNPVGAHPSGLIGEDPCGEINNLFPYINQVAFGIRDKLTIFGNDWPTCDGTGVRDYIHIMDLADAHCLALDFLINKNESQIFSINIGTGKGTSVLELLNTYEKVNQCKIPYVFSSRRPGDVGINFAKNELASSILNWIPKRDLNDMCKDGWNWKKLNPNGY